MIEFNYELDFSLDNPADYKTWITSCVSNYGYTVGDLNYIFCDDAYLLKLNIEYLDHDTLTDIISFDYTVDTIVSGDIFISLERVKENALTLDVSFKDELHRVMIHGVLHYLGYKDKTTSEKEVMRAEEDTCISIF
jgi:probable rRNA maturation factor